MHLSFRFKGPLMGPFFLLFSLAIHIESTHYVCWRSFKIPNNVVCLALIEFCLVLRPAAWNIVEA